MHTGTCNPVMLNFDLYVTIERDLGNVKVDKQVKYSGQRSLIFSSGHTSTQQSGLSTQLVK